VSFNHDHQSGTFMSLLRDCGIFEAMAARLMMTDYADAVRCPGEISRALFVFAFNKYNIVLFYACSHNIERSL